MICSKCLTKRHADCIGARIFKAWTGTTEYMQASAIKCECICTPATTPRLVLA